MRRTNLSAASASTLSVTALLTVALTVALAGCGLLAGERSQEPQEPLPLGVPEHPVYDDVATVLTKLDEGGITCTVVRGPSGDPRVGEQMTCDTELTGRTTQYTIHVYNPDSERWSDTSKALSYRLQPPFSQTVVAAGNWYIRVIPESAPRIASAVDGAVLYPVKGTPSAVPPTHPHSEPN